MKRKSNPIPESDKRQTVSGKVQITVRDWRGFTVVGSLPKGIPLKKGTNVVFTARLYRSANRYIGWYVYPRTRGLHQHSHTVN